MVKQLFILNNSIRTEEIVIFQNSMKLEAMTIQLSKVLDFRTIQYTKEHAEIPYRWIYEEIDNNDMVVYARYMSEENIKKNYSELLKKRGNMKLEEFIKVLEGDVDIYHSEIDYEGPTFCAGDYYKNLILTKYAKEQFKNVLNAEIVKIALGNGSVTIKDCTEKELGYFLNAYAGYVGTNEWDKLFIEKD